MISRLPGVNLTASAKKFARGRPKLRTGDLAPRELRVDVAPINSTSLPKLRRGR